MKFLSARKSYGMDESAQFVRPWQLAFRPDHAVSGLIEPEICELIIELILTEGCRSCRDMSVPRNVCVVAEKRKPADEAVKRQSMQDNEDEGEEEEEKVEDQEMVDAEASNKDEAEPEEK